MPTITRASLPPKLRRQVTEKPAKRARSKYEIAFEQAWNEYAPKDAPQPVTEYRWHPDRAFRFDFAWPAPYLLAVEIDGGTHMMRRNAEGKLIPCTSRDSSYDRWRSAAAAVLGWRIISFTPAMLRDPAACVQVVVEALKNK